MDTLQEGKIKTRECQTEDDPRRKGILCLPREIILDIASRMPIKSLTRFRFVCKTWLSFSFDPYLVDLQLHRALDNDPCLIFHSENTNDELHFVDFSDQGDEEIVTKIRIPFTNYLPGFTVIGSCNGILCLANPFSSDELCLYNPFIGKCHFLPKSTVLQKEDVLFGFGFDPTSNHYKVIKIVYYPNLNQESGKVHYREALCNRKSWQSAVQILSVGSQNWRNIGEVPENLRKTSAVATNGRLHWVSRDCRIISFNLSNEKFEEVPMPSSSSASKKWYSFQLVVLGGCLSAVELFTFGCQTWDIWIMKEYNVKESWVKQFSIRNYVEPIANPLFHMCKVLFDGRLVRVLCLLKNGEILLQFKDETLVSYNPETGESKNLVFRGMPNMFHTIVHQGSLNWIDVVSSWRSEGQNFLIV